MKNALIIGAAGFIGTYLTKRLSSEMNLTCIDNLSNGSEKRFKYINKNIDLLKLDLKELGVSKDKNYDYIFDLSYINGTRQFYTRGVEILRCAANNVSSSINLAKKYDAKLIYFSTPEVFGDTKIIPTPENSPFIIPDISNPRWSYSIGKIYCESLLHTTKQQSKDFCFNIVRPNNAYGPFDRFHVIPDLINLIKDNTSELVVRGDRNSTRSYCYITDMVEQIHSVATKADDGETYNLGNSQETSLQDLVNLLVELTQTKKAVKYSDPPEGSPTRRLPCTQKVDKICPIVKTDLKSGLQKVTNSEGYDPYNDF